MPEIALGKTLRPCDWGFIQSDIRTKYIYVFIPTKQKISFWLAKIKSRVLFELIHIAIIMKT